MSDLVLDLGGVYERAKKAAKQAVMGSPRTSYGLEDVMPEEQWAAVLSSGMASLLPVSGTLDGCVEAMHEREASAGDVESTQVVAPAGSSVTSEDISLARSWLVQGIGVDERARQKIVAEDVVERDWMLDPPLSSRSTSVPPRTAS